MENPLHNLITTTKRLRSLWTGFVDMFREPDRLWQIILLFIFCFALVIVTVAVIASQWAMNVELLPKDPSKKSNGISLSELDAVVSKYEERAVNFNALTSRPPESPSLERGYGPTTPLSVYEEEEAENTIPATTTPSS